MSELLETPIYQREHFKRLGRYWLVTHTNGATDITDMTVWGTYDTLSGAVDRFNALAPSEKEKSYVVKNVAWTTTVREYEAIDLSGEHEAPAKASSEATP